MKKLYFVLALLAGFTCNAQIINFPDPVFKAKLLAASPANNIASNIPFTAYVKIDTNNNGEIEQSEAALIGKLVISASGISDLTGINYFTNISQLICEGNSLTALDISSLTLIEYLNCENNQLVSIQFPPAPTDRNMSMNFYNNALTTINLSSFTLFYNLNLSNNQLTAIDLSSVTRLDNLNLSNNQLTAIDLGVKEISQFSLSNNPIVSFNYTLPPGSYIENFNFQSNTLVDFYFDASQAGSQSSLTLHGNNLSNVTYYAPDTGNNFGQNCDINGPVNQLDISGSFGTLNIVGISSETLDLSHCALNTFSLYESQTKYVNLKNGNVSSSNSVFGSENNQLEYVCADDGEVAALLESSIGWNESAEINSYCSFTPGGTFYTITGKATYDLLNNGCSTSDIAYPSLRYNISNGTINGSITSNLQGNYQIPVQEGTHTITPNVENPSYFNVLPPTVNISFPATASPHTQNFCLTANGVHPDLEVMMIPLGFGVPGFDAMYKIIYKNKGTLTLSGTISFAYENKVEFVSSDPAIASNLSNTLQWDFVNLQPFETREITFVMNVNSPLEIPAVNLGDILHYQISIASDMTDETPDNNQFSFNQGIQNSFDPNDKTCLEGNGIGIESVGKYVHYLIRFENSGTANARNIVVSDIIDTAKFDIASLIPMDGSHEFYTRINGNKVEFIFENIELPFDDTNNDGYVMFKIKTNPTLTVGDTFSNSASIYFDYNAPIVTDPAVTAIAILATKDFEFTDYFTIYPNPASNVLNIQKKIDVVISSITIYSILGQLMITIPNAQQISKIDVSNLTTGNYFIKINSDKGTTNAKFAKK